MRDWKSVREIERNSRTIPSHSANGFHLNFETDGSHLNTTKHEADELIDNNS